MLDTSDDEYSAYDFSEFAEEELLQIDAHFARESQDEYAAYNFPEFTEEELLQIDAHVVRMSQDAPKRVKLEPPTLARHAIMTIGTAAVSTHSSGASVLAVNHRRPQGCIRRNSSRLGKSGRTVTFELEPQMKLKRASACLGALSDSSDASKSIIKSEKEDTVKCTRAMSTKPLHDFFQHFSNFKYDSTQPAWDEFRRLAGFCRWNEYEINIKRRSFRIALVKEFNCIYGTDEDSIESWQKLCRVIGVKPLPETLEACREAVDGIHVNILDLVDISPSGGAMKLFDSETALSLYTRERKKYFPKESAYAGGFLKYLLRHILNPSEIPRPRRLRRR